MDTDSLVHRYFELAPRADPADYFAQFTPDTLVEDDGRRLRGIAEVRAWRSSVPAVSYEVRELVGTAATVEVTGDFPGSPVTLRFDFGFTPDGRIATLRIRP